MSQGQRMRGAGSAREQVPDHSTIHLRPTAALAERVLLPGDPGRALALAQSLLSDPRMFNHHRGLWGYTGSAADGRPLTIQATGMGGPSAAIVLSELIELGARRAIRVGTCGALSSSLGLGDLLVALEALCLDGTSRALGCETRAGADAALTESLLRHARGAHSGAVASVDLFYARDPIERRHRQGDGGRQALAVEMEAAALFALGADRGIAVACVLAVSDTFDRDGRRARIEDHALLACAERMGQAAVAALSP
jgi:DeoD family purine-nucleoside phosphorylase